MDNSNQDASFANPPKTIRQRNTWLRFSIMRCKHDQLATEVINDPSHNTQSSPRIAY